MTSDILSSLQFDKEFATSRVIVAKEINGCDSSFIICCVLGHCVKNKCAVFIVSMHNSLSHYQNVGLKMNYNLQKYIETGLVDIYNLGEDNVNMVLKNKTGSLQILYSNIKDKILLMKRKYGSVNVVLDGISHLFDMQYTLREVNHFCKEIIALVRDCSNAFVLCQCSVASEDDATNVMANLLTHKGHTVLEVESLSSGWSADVSGHLTIRYAANKFEDHHMFTMDIKPSRYLFKLYDRGVKLFAPGTV